MVEVLEGITFFETSFCNKDLEWNPDMNRSTFVQST